MTDKSTKSQEDDYDPHENRDIKNPMKNYEAFALYIKGSIGTGTLSMPKAFARTGYLIGLLLMVIIPIVALHGLHILIRSIYTLSKRKRVPMMTYSEALAAAFEEGPPLFQKFSFIASHIVNVFLSLYHFGGCCVYIVFITKNLREIVAYYGPTLPIRVHICFLIVPLVMVFSVRDLKNLTPFTYVSNVLLLTGLSIVLYYLFLDLPPISQRNPTNELSKIPMFFGTVMFALESVGVIIAIESKMEQPKSYLRWYGVMNMGMLFSTVLHLLVGFIGYWQYGDDLRPSLTLNIPDEVFFPQIVKMMYAVGILLTYPLQGYVPADVVWNNYLIQKFPNPSTHIYGEFGVRAVILLLTFLLALAFPYLTLVRSLVGAFCVSVLGFIFPALLQICIHYPSDYGRYRIILLKDIALAAFGTIFFVMGTYVTIEEMITTYKS